MANEYKLSYTAQEIDEKLGQISTPDWEQNDTGKADYIKNKPFYKEASDPITLIGTGSEAPTLIDFEEEVIAGQKYNVTVVNGDEIEDRVYTAYTLSDFGALGNGEDFDKIIILGLNDDGDIDDWCLYVNCGISDEGMPIYQAGKAVYMVMADSVTFSAMKIHKIGLEYLPDEVSQVLNLSDKMTEIELETKGKITEYLPHINYSYTQGSHYKDYPTVNAVRQYMGSSNQIVKHYDKYKSDDTPAVVLGYTSYDSFTDEDPLYLFDVISYTEGSDYFNNNFNNSEINNSQPDEYIGVDECKIAEIKWDSTGIHIRDRKPNYNNPDSNLVEYITSQDVHNNVTSFAKINNNYYFVVPSTASDIVMTSSKWNEPYGKQFSIDEDIYYNTSLTSGNISKIKDSIDKILRVSLVLKKTKGSVDKRTITRQGYIKNIADSDDIYIGNLALKDASAEDTGEDFLMYCNTESYSDGIYECFFKSDAMFDDLEIDIASSLIVDDGVRWTTIDMIDPLISSMLVCYNTSSRKFSELPNIKLPNLTDNAKLVYCDGYIYLLGGSVKSKDMTTSYSNSRIFRIDVEQEQVTTLDVRLPLIVDRNNRPPLAAGKKIYIADYCIDLSQSNHIEIYRHDLDVILDNATSVLMDRYLVGPQIGLYDTISGWYIDATHNSHMYYNRGQKAVCYNNTYFIYGFSSASSDATAYIKRSVFNIETIKKYIENYLGIDFDENNINLPSHIKNKPFYETISVNSSSVLYGYYRSSIYKKTGLEDIEEYPTYPSVTVDYVGKKDDRYYDWMRINYDHVTNDENYAYYYDMTKYRLYIGNGNNSSNSHNQHMVIRDFMLNPRREDTISRFSGLWAGNLSLYDNHRYTDTGEDFLYFIDNGVSYLIIDRDRIRNSEGVLLSADNPVTLNIELHAMRETTEIKTLDSKYIPDYISKAEMRAYVAQQIALLKAELQGT